MKNKKEQLEINGAQKKVGIAAMNSGPDGVVMSGADALKLVEKEIDPQDSSIYASEQAYRTVKFVPNLNPDRSVNVYSPIIENSRLYIKPPYGVKNKKYAGSITGRVMNLLFGPVIAKHKHGDQVMIILSDGLQLIGCISAYGAVRQVMLPKSHFPDGVAAPEIGQVLPVKAIKLIVG